MTEQIDSTEKVTYLNGIYERIPQTGGIPLPKEWQKIFPNLSEITLLYDGDKIIGITSSEVPPHGAIQHKVIVKHGAFRPPKAFYKSHQLSTPSKVWLVGKGNHIEIYLSQEEIDTARKQSIKLAKEFQKKLLGRL